MIILKITDSARDLLKQVFQEKDAAGIRVYFAGYGWGGPQIGLALDEPEADDIIETISEIQVAFDPEIKPHTVSMILDHDKENERLVLLGNESDCC